VPALPADSRPVVDYEDPRAAPLPGFAVRADGTVLYLDGRRPRKVWRPLKVKTGPGGFTKVRINLGGRVREVGVAHLVLRAFVGPRPTGCEPLHFPDPDPANNRLENLRWAPRGTSKAGRTLGPTAPPATRGDDHPFAVLSEADVPRVRSLYRAGFGYKEIAEKHGVHPETVRKLLKGETWSHVPDPEGPLVMRRRGPDAEASNLARLDWGLAEEIRGHLAAGMRPKQVAAIYEISVSAVRDIQHGRTWRAPR